MRPPNGLRNWVETTFDAIVLACGNPSVPNPEFGSLMGASRIRGLIPSILLINSDQFVATERPILAVHKGLIHA
jgi:hypothetical protein